MDWSNPGALEPFAFRRTGDADFPIHIKGLLLGPPKSGKTTTLATFPNVVVADVEAGLMSIAHRNIAYVTIDAIEKLQSMLYVLRDPAMRARAAESMGLAKIETVGIDTMDSLQELFKAERLRAEGRTQFQKPDWGWLLDQFVHLMDEFNKLPMHVIYTCHTKTIEAEEGPSVIMPGLQGAIAEKIAGKVGFAMMMRRTREVDPETGLPFTQYRLQVEGDEKTPHLGNRAMGMLRGEIEPSFEVLHRTITEGLAAAQLPQQQTGQIQVQLPQQPGQEAQAPQSEAQAPQSTPQQPQQAPQVPGRPPVNKPNDDDPINQGARDSLSVMLREWGFVLPDNSVEWTMGKGRDVAKMFIAVKGDVASSKVEQEAAHQMLRDFLVSMDAYQDPSTVPPEGTIDEVTAWVGSDVARATVALEREKKGKDRATLKKALERIVGEQAQPDAAQPEPAQPAPEPAPEPAPAPPSAPAPEPAPQPAPQPAPAQEPASEQVLKEELGAQLVSEAPVPAPPTREELMRLSDKAQAPPCQITGAPIDDLDIAKLALQRFGMWLCVDAYINKTKEARA